MDQFASSDEEEEEQVMITRRKRMFRERINFFSFEAHDFKMRFRLRPKEAEFVLSFIGNDLKHQTLRNKALSPQQQFLTALHWLSNGSQYHGVGDMHGLSKATVCRAVHRVVLAILRKMLNRVVRWPEDCSNISQKFLELGGFPQVCGAVDGTLINVIAPRQHEEQFVDRHGNHSLNVMMISGPDNVFYAVNASYPGSVHDSRVLRSSRVTQLFNTGYRPFPGAVILGDSAYGLSDWLIPPFRRNPTDPVEQRFNVAHKRTRRIVECSFGMLKNRFPCLRFLRCATPEFAAKVVMACAVLHNIATKKDFNYIPPEEPEEIIPPTGNANSRINQLLAFFR